MNLKVILISVLDEKINMTLTIALLIPQSKPEHRKF